MSRLADESFEEFVRSRSAHLYRLALLLTGQQADAQDFNAAIDRRRLPRRRSEHPLDDTAGRSNTAWPKPPSSRFSADRQWLSRSVRYSRPAISVT